MSDPPVVSYHHHHAAAAAAAVAAAVNNGQTGYGLSYDATGHLPLATHASSQQHLLIAFWQNQLNEIENNQYDFKQHTLPLARIKKVMKTDEDVKVSL